LRPDQLSNALQDSLSRVRAIVCYGWYLIRLAEKKDSRQLSFEESRKTIEEKIYNQRKRKKLDEFLIGLREKSFVKILIPDPLGR